jgi:hypothetical protein
VPVFAAKDATFTAVLVGGLIKPWGFFVSSKMIFVLSEKKKHLFWLFLLHFPFF